MNKKVLVSEMTKGRNHKLKKHSKHIHGKDVDLEFTTDDTHEIETLDMDGLPTAINGIAIRWFHNFGIKMNGQYIKNKYKIKIAGISNLGASKLVICDSSGIPKYYEGEIINDTIELSDGDPSTGSAP